MNQYDEAASYPSMKELTLSSSPRSLLSISSSMYFSTFRLISSSGMSLSSEPTRSEQDGQTKSRSSRWACRHSSQYVVKQHGVCTAEVKSLVQSGQAREESEGASSRTSEAVTILGFARCFSQVALSIRSSALFLCERGKWECEKDVHVRFGDDESSFGCDHDSSRSTLCGHRRLNDLQETSRNTRRPLEARLVVEVLVLVCRAGLNPMTCILSVINICGYVGEEARIETYRVDRIDSRCSLAGEACRGRWDLVRNVTSALHGQLLLPRGLLATHRSVSH